MRIQKRIQLSLKKEFAVEIVSISQTPSEAGSPFTLSVSVFSNDSNPPGSHVKERSDGGFDLNHVKVNLIAIVRELKFNIMKCVA